MSLLLGLFDRPADAGCLKALWKAPVIPDLTEPLVGMSEAHRNVAFAAHGEPGHGRRAARAGRSPAAARIFYAGAEQRPEAWRAARRRLYEHLCATTKDKAQPSCPRSKTGELHLIVDSTGLKLRGVGEWLFEKHGTSKRRSFVARYDGQKASLKQSLGRTLVASIGPVCSAALRKREGGAAHKVAGKLLRDGLIEEIPNDMLGKL